MTKPKQNNEKKEYDQNKKPKEEPIYIEREWDRISREWRETNNPQNEPKKQVKGKPFDTLDVRINEIQIQMLAGRPPGSSLKKYAINKDNEIILYINNPLANASTATYNGISFALPNKTTNAEIKYEYKKRN